MVQAGLYELMCSMFVKFMLLMCEMQTYLELTWRHVVLKPFGLILWLYNPYSLSSCTHTFPQILIPATNSKLPSAPNAREEQEVLVLFSSVSCMHPPSPYSESCMRDACLFVFPLLLSSTLSSRHGVSMGLSSGFGRRHCLVSPCPLGHSPWLSIWCLCQPQITSLQCRLTPLLQICQGPN